MHFIHFGLIDPHSRTFQRLRAISPEAVYLAAGIVPGKVDHCILLHKPGGGGAICAAVYEFGLFVKPSEQHFFAIGNTLIAGAAVLYETDAAGVTIDLDPRWLSAPRWFGTLFEIEAEIAAGTLNRPALRINGHTIWTWPQPAPAGTFPA